jgi:hypothetical protein
MLESLRAVGAIGRLRDACGFNLDEQNFNSPTPALQHADLNSALAQLPLPLQLLSLELIAARLKQGAASCPICRTPHAFPINPGDGSSAHTALDIATHVLQHFMGEWDEGTMRVRHTGSCFTIAASIVGMYFEHRQCERWLHRAARRIEGGGREEIDIETLIDPFRRAHTTRGEEYEDVIVEQLLTRGLAANWAAFSSVDATAAAASAAAAAVTGRRIVFVDATLQPLVPFSASSAFAGARRGYVFKADTLGVGYYLDRSVGLFIDLKRRAQQRCGCCACHAALAGQHAGLGSAGTLPAPDASTACSIYRAYDNVSREALTATYTQPVMLYQLLLRPPQPNAPEAERADFWTRVRGTCPPCDTRDAHGERLALDSGEPRDTSLTRGYLDYLLLTPSACDETGHPPPAGPAPPNELVCTVIDAKATQRVKLGAKVQIAIYTIVLEAVLGALGKLAGTVSTKKITKQIPAHTRAEHETGCSVYPPLASAAAL